MVKKLGLLLALSALFLLVSCGVAPLSNENNASNVNSDREFRGVWVSTVFNLDYPSKPGLDEKTLKEEALFLLDKAQEMGINAVVLQVRPCGDAIYPSKFYPWSEYISGKSGVALDGDFDVLKFWIEQAHARGMELHAWINPFRVTHGGNEDEPKCDVSKLATENPGRKHPEWLVEYKGNLYLNPGIPEVREYIKAGVEEIIKNYSVDGIHFDDYFYPGEEFDDSDSFLKYGSEYSDVSDWRRDNVNKLVFEVNELVDSVNPDIRFGISPFAIWQNKASLKQGSDTRGLEAYHTYYADSRAWVKNGWVDYIAPQIYWSIGNDGADYQTLLSWWTDVVRDTDVDLYIGHAGYRSFGAKPGDVWYGADEIERQIRLNRRYDAVDGSIHFRLKMYIENPVLTDALKKLYLQ